MTPDETNAEALRLNGVVLAFFGGNPENATLWWITPNPNLGGAAPAWCVHAGRIDVVSSFIEFAVAENKQ